MPVIQMSVPPVCRRPGIPWVLPDARVGRT